MTTLLLALLVGCSPGAADVRDDHGTLLMATGTQWVVQHDDPLSRTVQGSEVYVNSDVSAPAGSHVDLWISRDATEMGSITKSRVIGAQSLPVNHINGGSVVVGTVVRAEPTKLLLDHEPIPDVMPAMVMPFIAARSDTAALTPGDRVTGRIIATAYGYAIADLDVIGSVDVSGAPQGDPLAIGEVLASVTLDGHDGQPVVLGAEQEHPTVVAFVYTTCPDPNYCPATVAKLQALLPVLPDDARIVAVTIDPATDTVPVLAEYAELVGAEAPRWTFARPSPAQLHTLAVAAGLTVSHRSGRIAHSTRVLVLDAEGALTVRFDDNAFRRDEAIEAARPVGHP